MDSLSGPCSIMSANWKPEEASTEEMQTFCNKVREDLEKKIGHKSVFNTTTFRAVDTHIKYIAKVDVGSGDFVHVKISQELPCYGKDDVTMIGYQFPKTSGDEIVPF